MKRIDRSYLINQKQGRLLVIDLLPNGYIRCVCDCNKVVDIRIKEFIRKDSRRVKSCGCLRVDTISSIRRTHGLTGTKIYRAWYHMIGRCYDKNDKAYKYYGLRGIAVCDKWRKFEGFYEDMKDGYEDHLTLERIRVNEDYSKLNCKWATWIEQARNKTNTVYVEYNSEIKTTLEWGEIFGIGAKLIQIRLKNGKSVSESFLPSKRK